MNPKNDFKAFSIRDGANVVAQNLYENSPELQTGFSPDGLTLHILNKALRQSSTISSVVADFIATESDSDVLDDGNITKLTTQLNRALERKIITKISDSALEKAQNGADIPNKNAFLKNLGLNEAAKREVGIGVNQIPDMSFFTKNLAETGWQKLPSGLIEMWGTALVKGNALSSPGNLNKFPIPFPNKCLNVTLTHLGTAPQYAGIFSVMIVDNTQFQCFSSITDLQNPVAAYYRAVGY
ncbi:MULTISPECIES: gp53-like domain-containing protein [Photorhabdus]|uniref:gp53-like domain-containing protein n=1 Tax=Photorhabdus TaxID=29487 RepID=UPI0007B49DE9|nr:MULTISPECIES: phage tail protein [Photorhabdus]AWK43013.1 phage tail protein [Photorhabdus laumondii subsp. laumondii]AXG43778.1 phage tail protein [Photorhabdus laumondii subsp. laumondii]MCC8389677.1 phage tail protein [Photorhabdus laumondii]MCZ1251768.1 phage tail protein [Photorhabdus laumondii subsp. laumondii]NDL18001.1 phage tail protein [Photorhabdus laumondii subsp. laumondii]